MDYYYNHGGLGDKKLIYRTDVIKKYPQYPVFEGEKYVSLAYKYRLIGKDYFLGVINKPVCVVEYQENGSSMNMYRQYLNNPKGFAFIRKINMQYIDDKKEILLIAFIMCQVRLFQKIRVLLKNRQRN